MNLRDTARLLAVIQVADNRRVDELTISEWHHNLAEVSVNDAIAVARAHRVTSGEYLTVRHIRDGVRALKAQRVVGIDSIQPPADLDPDDTAAYIAWRRATIAAIAAGDLEPPEPDPLPGGPPPEVRALLEKTGRHVPCD